MQVRTIISTKVKNRDIIEKIKYIGFSIIYLVLILKLLFKFSFFSRSLYMQRLIVSITGKIIVGKKNKTYQIKTCPSCALIQFAHSRQLYKRPSINKNNQN